MCRKENTPIMVSNSSGMRHGGERKEAGGERGGGGGMRPEERETDLRSGLGGRASGGPRCSVLGSLCACTPIIDDLLVLHIKSYRQLHFYKFPMRTCVVLHFAAWDRVR